VADADDTAPKKESRQERVERRRQERAARARPTKSQSGHVAERTGFTTFIRECVAELKRVQWPTRPVLIQATAVVIVMCLIVGLYLYGLDSIFSKLAGWLINQQAG
jgi:preprotein translocase subunit SecE